MEYDVICSAKKKGRDLTIDTLKLAGKDPVRDILILTPKDVLKKKDGKNVFTMSYRLNNEGFLSSQGFENIAYFNDKVVAKQPNLSFTANESRVLKDEVALDIKDGVFLVRIDAFSRIAEDDETNNDISCKVVFKGFQAGSASEAQLHIEFLRVSGRTPVRGQIKLSEKDVKGKEKGRYSFVVEYVIRNYGMQDASGFDNVFLLEGKSFYRQPNLSLKAGESRLVQVPVYFPPHSGKFSIQMDPEGKYPGKGPGLSHVVETQIYFQGLK